MAVVRTGVPPSVSETASSRSAQSQFTASASQLQVAVVLGAVGCGVVALGLGHPALGVAGLIVGAICGLDSLQRSGEHLEWTEHEFAVVPRTGERQTVDLSCLAQIHLEREIRGSRRMTVSDAEGHAINFDIGAYRIRDGWKQRLAASVTPTTQVNPEAAAWLSRG